MTVGVLGEVETIYEGCIDDVVLLDDGIEPPNFFSDDDDNGSWKESRVKLTFLGNRPSVKKTKNPTLHLLLEDTTSPVNVTNQRYQAMYFSISPKSIAGRYWDNTLITNEDERIFVGKNLRRTTPFQAREKFHWALYPNSWFGRIYDLTKPQLPKEPHHHEKISKLYNTLREDFDYAMDSTEKIWRPGRLPLRMLSGRGKGIGEMVSVNILSVPIAVVAVTASLLVMDSMPYIPSAVIKVADGLLIGAGLLTLINYNKNEYRELRTKPQY